MKREEALGRALELSVDLTQAINEALTTPAPAEGTGSRCDCGKTMEACAATDDCSGQSMPTPSPSDGEFEWKPTAEMIEAISRLLRACSRISCEMLAREPDYEAAAVEFYGQDGHYSSHALERAHAIVDAALARRGGDE